MLTRALQDCISLLHAIHKLSFKSVSEGRSVCDILLRAVYSYCFVLYVFGRIACKGLKIAQTCIGKES